jgi:hypothetical protein
LRAHGRLSMQGHYGSVSSCRLTFRAMIALQCMMMMQSRLIHSESKNMKVYTELSQDVLYAATLSMQGESTLSFVDCSEDK